MIFLTVNNNLVKKSNKMLNKRSKKSGVRSQKAREYKFTPPAPLPPSSPAPLHSRFVKAATGDENLLEATFLVVFDQVFQEQMW